MYRKPLESDWRLYRDNVAGWRERYLARKNEDLVAMLHDEDKTPTERFWAAKERMAEEARLLRDCLDRHSRSQMGFHLRLMVRYGMVSAEDLAEFSEELRQNVLMHD